ncbi:MAG TPA: YggS family pyridoxal phosphate-dependent enzyme [Bacteroidales bacterium]|nr:YggS family pyridoxal phosphate-dependent enzyme [Bacteroidales bacterium]
MGEIAGNIGKIKGSLPSGVSLIAVSKTRTAGEIMDAYNCGHRLFGENKVQELLNKKDILPSDIQWHIIGHLQTNKVKLIASFISMIESVDSIKLLELIDQEAKKNNREIDILLQVHIATEETKFGFDIQEIESIDWTSVAANLKNVRIRGLMGMASFSSEEQMVRGEFKKLKSIFISIREKYFQNIDYFSEISMGMSGDWPIAVEEGSTMIRVGSAIFGQRKYS